MMRAMLRPSARVGQAFVHAHRDASLKVAIVGAGNGGLAAGAHLKLLGCEVRLADNQEAQLKEIRANNNTIKFGGPQAPMQGDAQMDLITTDTAEAVQGADLVLCNTAASAHWRVAESLASCLEDGQSIMLHPGRTGGVLEVRKILRDEGCAADVTITEAQTLLYACRRSGAEVSIKGYKSSVKVCGLPGRNMPKFFEKLQPLIPNFQPPAEGNNLWLTSLDNIGMLFHPTPTLLNLSRMEGGRSFEYYHDGFSPSVSQLVEKLDAERIAVAKALGVDLPTAPQWLAASYGAKGSGLYETIQSCTAYKDISAPELADVKGKLNLRYITEDVPTGLVPFSELGRVMGVPTPCIDVIIQLASIMYETDFRAKGRSLEQLGLDGMTPDQLRNLQ